MPTLTYLASLLHATELAATRAELPTGQIVEIPTLSRGEQRWAGPVPESFSSVPNKPTLQFDGQPVWAELILLRFLEGDGWRGAWVKNWGGRAFWRNVREPVELSPSA